MRGFCYKCVFEGARTDCSTKRSGAPSTTAGVVSGGFISLCLTYGPYPYAFTVI